MSHHSENPGGMSDQPQLVPYVRLSPAGDYTYQCSYNCRIGCCGDQHCTGKKVPIMSAGVPPTPPNAFPASSSISSITNNARSPSVVAVVPPSAPAKPVPEINQLLMRTSASPLDPSSPSTQELMKGLFLLVISTLIRLSDSEVAAFAQWRAINEKQRDRQRDLARREKVQDYKGKCQLYKCLLCYFYLLSYIFDFCSLAKARCLPPDVIIFPEYDPSEDMDQKITRKKSKKRALESVSPVAPPAAKSSRQCSTPANTTLPSPPSTPPSPAFEPVSTAGASAYADVPLNALPSGFVIHGKFY